MFRHAVLGRIACGHIRVDASVQEQLDCVEHVVVDVDVVVVVVAMDVLPAHFDQQVLCVLGAEAGGVELPVVLEDHLRALARAHSPLTRSEGDRILRGELALLLARLESKVQCAVAVAISPMARHVRRDAKVEEYAGAVRSPQRARNHEALRARRPVGVAPEELAQLLGVVHHQRGHEVLLVLWERELAYRV